MLSSCIAALTGTTFHHLQLVRILCTIPGFVDLVPSPQLDYSNTRYLGVKPSALREHQLVQIIVLTCLATSTSRLSGLPPAQNSKYTKYEMGFKASALMCKVIHGRHPEHQQDPLKPCSEDCSLQLGAPGSVALPTGRGKRVLVRASAFPGPSLRLQQTPRHQRPPQPFVPLQVASDLVFYSTNPE